MTLRRCKRFVNLRCVQVTHSSQMMWDKQIYSCPVVDGDGKVINVIDLNDVVYYHLAEANTGQQIVFKKYLSDEAKEQARSGKVFCALFDQS